MKLKYKQFDKSRVCVIDSFPILLKSVQDVAFFCSSNNIAFNTSGRGSGDVHNLFYNFCIENIDYAYNNIKTHYPKVLLLYPFSNHQSGAKIANYFLKSKVFEKVLKILPYPCCKVSTYNDKEMEAAAIAVIEKHKVNYTKITKFANVKRLDSVLSRYRKTKAFSHGFVPVDELPLDTDKENVKKISR